MKYVSAFLMIIGMLLITPMVYSETIYVGDGETYTTIQSAVDAAESGDLVIVKDGTYNEVDIKKPLTLKSENGYTNTTIVYNGRNINIYSSKVIVEGFTLYGENSPAIYVHPNANYCIIRNNQLGLNDNNSNYIGIECRAEKSIIVHNIFQSNTENGILLKGGYNTILYNTFIGSNYAINIENNYNRIYQNSFINQLQTPIKAKMSQLNYFHSPFEIRYIWKGSYYKSRLGNYYSDFPTTINDIDENGVIEGYYPMPYSEPNDNYPLVSKASDYTPHMFFPQNNNTLSKTVDQTSLDQIEFNRQASIVWTSEKPYETTTTFSGEDHWAGTIDFNYSFYEGETIQVSIGYSTKEKTFVSIFTKRFILSSSTQKFSFYMDKKAISIESGQYLAIKLTNYSNRDNKIFIGNAQTYISPPLSYTRPPIITNMSHDKVSVERETFISIKGLNLGDQPGNVLFNEQAAAIEYWSNSLIVCNPPPHESGFSTIRIEGINQLSTSLLESFYFHEGSLYVGKENHFQSIQQAVKYASEGDIITVFPGKYNENIDINKTLHLKSQSGSNSATIVGGDLGDIIINISGNNTIIQGFTIYGSYTSSTGVYAEASSCTIVENRFGADSKNSNEIGISISDKTSVKNNIFSMNNKGVYLYDDDYCKIVDNTFFSNDYGIVLDDYPDNTIISDNTFLSNTNGIYAYSSSNNTIFGNKFLSNINGIKSKYSSNNYFYNSFIGNNKTFFSFNRYQNTWHSPVPLYYTYNGQSFVSYIGNYFSKNVFPDMNSDGITDNHYYITGTEPEDNFPLLNPIDQYNLHLFSLSKDDTINTFDQIQTKYSISLSPSEPRTWTMPLNEWLKTLLLQQNEISGNLLFSAAPESGATFTIEIGLILNDGHFIQKGVAEIQSNGNNIVLSYQMKIDSMTDEDNRQFALKITNNSNKTYSLITGSLTSCFYMFPESKNYLILNISPDQGPTNGDTGVLISGVNLGNIQDDTQILFGNTPVSVYTSWSNTSILCQAPPNEKGWVDVSIKKDGLIQIKPNVKYLYKDGIYVGKSQMFSSIQQAINHAQPDDIITVTNGEYIENIIMNKPIVLKSESGYLSTTIISEQPDSATILMEHEKATIDGFTIIGSNAISANKDFLIIRNNRCGTGYDQNNSIGIFIDSNNNIVDNNILSFNNDYGIKVNYRNINNRISNNTCYNNDQGIIVEGDLTTVISNSCHDNFVSGIYVSSRNNSILYNNCERNYEGINIHSSYNNIHANICAFNSYSGVYVYLGNNIISENICKFNEQFGTYVKTYGNIIYLNQYMTLSNIDVYVYGDSNTWYSPIPLSYSYKDIQYFGYIGNYYLSHYSSDNNNDGIFDEKYSVISDSSEGDLYPLSDTIENYQANILFFHPDGRISQNDTISTELFSIPKNDSALWQTFESTVSDVDFTQSQKINGQITIYYKYNNTLKKNDTMIVTPGYLDGNNAFVSIADPVILIGDGNSKRFDYQTKTKSISSGFNGPMVIQVENPNEYNIDILTGSRWSFISMGAISGRIPEPENDEYMISSGGTLSIKAPGILENDFNPEDTQLTAILKNKTNYGSLTLNADGSFTYVHNGSSFATSDQFTYKINNGYEDSIRTAQVSIQIIHAPVITLSPNQNVTNSNMTITIAGNAGSTIEYSLNDGEWQTYIEPVVISNEGNHNITARLEDQNQEWLISQPLSFVIDKTPPEPPILNSNSPQTNIQTSVNEIEVSWLTPDDLLSDVIGYFYLLDDNADSVPDNTIVTEMLSFTSQSKESGITYYFHVCAIDSANNVSEPLHVGPFIITDTSPPPPQPTNLKVIKQMDGTVRLEWDYIDQYDHISYFVYRSEMPDGQYYRIDTGGHGFYSINNQKVYYTDRDLTNGQVYYYKVKSFWNNKESQNFSNRVFATPEKSFEFSCRANGYDRQTIGLTSRMVEVGRGVKYYFQIMNLEKFKGVVEASCNGLPDNVSFSFIFNEEHYGTSMNDIKLPASFILSISVGSAAVPGEYQFKLSLQNVWENASSDFMEIPLMLTIKDKYDRGILMDISKQPELSLFETRKRNQYQENAGIQLTRNQPPEPVKYRMSMDEPVEIYGEILPKRSNKTITLQLTSSSDSFSTSTTITTNNWGKFSKANWLSTFGLNEYTLQASWTDNSTTYVSSPRTIIIEKGKPQLTCNSRSSTTPKLFKDYTISGSIQPAKPGSHVYLSVISPDQENYTRDLVLDERGDYEITHKFFNKRGIWKIKAYWFGDDTHIGCESPFLILPVDTSAGRGMILGGGIASVSNSFFGLVKKMTSKAYRDFKARGFTDDMIYYAINSQMVDIDHDEKPDDVVDNNRPSAESFLSAIENKFVNEVNEELPLFIYMFGHGTDDGRFIVMGNDESIEASQLSQSLSIIQEKTGCVVILILESCFSGNFIKNVSGSNRIIMTSTGNSRYQMDSIGEITFSRFLFKEFLQNNSLKYSFEYAKEQMQNIGYLSPLLDDNGDGFSNEMDGDFANHYYFKGNITINISVKIDENSIQMPYLISSARPVKVSTRVIRGDKETESVYAYIIPPNVDLAASDDLISFRKTVLTYNPETQRYEGQLLCLIEAGLYKVVFMAKQIDNTISNPVVEYLTVEQPAVFENEDIDGNGIVDLSDVIIGLQTLSGFNVMLCDKAEAAFGLDDFIKLLQVIAN